MFRIDCGCRNHLRSSARGLLVKLLPALAVPEARERFVDRDPREPGRELRASGKIAEMAISADIRVLHHVFHLIVIPQNATHSAVKTLVVATHDQLIERRLAGEDAFDYLLVGEGIGANCRG